MPVRGVAKTARRRACLSSASTPGVPICAAARMATAVVLACCSAPQRESSIGDLDAVGDGRRTGWQSRFCGLSSRNQAGVGLSFGLRKSGPGIRVPPAPNRIVGPEPPGIPGRFIRVDELREAVRRREGGGSHRAPHLGRSSADQRACHPELRSTPRGRTATFHRSAIGMIGRCRPVPPGIRCRWEGGNPAVRKRPVSAIAIASN